MLAIVSFVRAKSGSMIKYTCNCALGKMWSTADTEFSPKPYQRNRARPQRALVGYSSIIDFVIWESDSQIVNLMVIMISRIAQKEVSQLAKEFKAVAIVGPWQSGKTTLARHVFGNKPYVSLENPDMRIFATEDPRGFLSQFPDGAILDEAQRTPQLFHTFNRYSMITRIWCSL